MSETPIYDALRTETERANTLPHWVGWLLVAALCAGLPILLAVI
jgi:hypothetical protein